MRLLRDTWVTAQRAGITLCWMGVMDQWSHGLTDGLEGDRDCRGGRVL